MKVSLFFHIWYFLIALSPNFTVIFNITHLFATDQQTGASKCFFLCKTLVLTAHLFLFFFSFMFSEHKCYGPSPERQQERCLCVWIPQTHLPGSKIASSIEFPPAANFLTAKQNSGWPPPVDVCPSHRLLLTTWVTWIASTLSFQHFSKVIKWTRFHLPWSLKGLYI